MEGINRVILQGNLGAEPEVRVLESGIKVATFRLATNESYVDANGKMGEHTEWHSIVAWRTTADYAHKNLKTGSPVRVEGKIRSRISTAKGAQPGDKVYEIVANSIQLLSDDTRPAMQSHPKNAWQSTPTSGYPRPQSRTAESEEIAPAPHCADNLPF